ncbi:hypothetical protein [Parasitella parasitica]|uniref:Uncharacterized protein n=1 Tax=Parasitella parasitica TaxID=35722 RepID=A0A0B7N5D3_9FUNG|nr:hypothetical protein [Parasitella parasitica]
MNPINSAITSGSNAIAVPTNSPSVATSVGEQLTSAFGPNATHSLSDDVSRQSSVALVNSGDGETSGSSSSAMDIDSQSFSSSGSTVDHGRQLFASEESLNQLLV